MRALSLFSGIGGLDIAAEMAGIEIVGQCEIDKHCQNVLRKHRPGIPLFDDITQLTGDMVHAECGQIDIIFGGFPCQPFSLAGLRGGASDKRFLWPEIARLLREIEPQWFVGENVLGLLSIDTGRTFGAILASLAEMGRDARWGVLRASDVKAPHQRERVFITSSLANASCIPRRRTENVKGWGGCGGIREKGASPDL